MTEERGPASVADDTVRYVTRPGSTQVETHLPTCAAWKSSVATCRGRCIEEEFA